MRMRKLISFDWAMKKLLRSKANFEILEGFLSELLKDDIKILEILESESNKDNSRDKFNRVDLKVKNLKDEIIVIEVQYDRELDYLQRLLFGASRVITEHLDKGDPYSNIVKVVSVSILYFDLGQGTDYVYYGQTSFTGIHKQDTLQLSEEQQEVYKKNGLHEIFPEYYLIKVNNFDDIAKNTLDEWIYFLKNEEIKENFSAKGLKKAKEELSILKLPEEERRAYERYEDDLHYQASMVESTYTVGMLKGKKDGREEGLKEGRQEGKEEGRQEIALNLISAGLLDLESISRFTGLTLEKVKMLKDKVTK
ncbi:MAG: Rpn family recombination-promoting nuclease/putative transposase [Desulfamplus sp.]|nr:Rpn family recombination-promoting nuclease/putative transposase [Desulfamplus sp.]